MFSSTLRQSLCPAYLSSLLQQQHPKRSVRSSSKLPFTVPSVNSVTYGEHAFSFSAPTLWNSLPDSIINTILSFKSTLKMIFLIYFIYFINLDLCLRKTPSGKSHHVIIVTPQFSLRISVNLTIEIKLCFQVSSEQCEREKTLSVNLVLVQFSIIILLQLTLGESLFAIFASLA